ncbi:MAG: hypothetical protein JKY34_03720 [Kordiimonadaceae bacterium]|nr:hypothetical protein [Kordiimonadaceae bacterium]
MLDVYGAQLVGIPGVSIGFNKKCWLDAHGVNQSARCCV